MKLMFDKHVGFMMPSNENSTHDSFFLIFSEAYFRFAKGQKDSYSLDESAV